MILLLIKYFCFGRFSALVYQAFIRDELSRRELASIALCIFIGFFLIEGFKILIS